MKQVILIGDFNEDEEVLKGCLHLLFPDCSLEFCKGYRDGLAALQKYASRCSRR